MKTNFKYGVYVAGEGHRHFTTFEEAKTYERKMRRENWYVCLYQIGTDGHQSK